MKDIIIAIDGHSSTGKSTVAKALAERLGYTYIDTGAMYRCVAYWSIMRGFGEAKLIDSEELVASLKDVRIRFSTDSPTNQQFALLNDENIEKHIRGLRVSQTVSTVAAIPEVRDFLVRQQQEMGNQKAIVMDGRDIGTVVFPNAELKIFMTAEAGIRARRRYDELKQSDNAVGYEEILANVIERDYMDENRKTSPLKKASDAVLLNNSFLNKEEQLGFIEKLAAAL